MSPSSRSTPAPASCLSLGLSLFAGGGELAVAFREDGFVPSVEAILRRHVADGAVQSNGVVVLDVACHDTTSIVHRKRGLRTQAFALEGFVPAFDFAVGLGIIGCGV